jgi:hypothetical protein
MPKYIVTLMQEVTYEVYVPVEAVDAATAEQMVRDAYLYRWGLDRDNSTVYLAGPLDCGGIREVDVHGSKGPL